jgi:transforming growth factor-beta-induced protein
LLRQYGLEDDLEEAGTLTVFVPYDTAFRFLDFEFEKDLDFDTARDVLIFHAVVPNIVPSKDLECEGFLSMVNARDSRTYCRGDIKFQKGAGNDIEAMPKLLVKDIPVCNGVIHIVDRVLLPYAVPRL